MPNNDFLYPTSLEELKKAIEYDIKNILPKVCFHLDDTNEKCTEKIIKAHSIQNNRYLKMLSENGMVCMVDSENFIENFRNGQSVEFKKIGRGIATTFKMFCSFHDNDIFKSIENFEFDESKEHNLAFALRSLCLERYKKIKVIEIYKNAIERECKTKFINFSERVRMFSLISLGAKRALIQMQNEHRKFKLIHDGINTENLMTFVINIKQEPTIAVSTCMEPDYDFENVQINNWSLLHKSPALTSKKLYFNIIPHSENLTKCIFSWFQCDNDLFQSLFENYQLLESKQKLRVLNNFIATYTEHIVIKPSHWNSMNSFSKNKFTESFCQTSFNLKRLPKPLMAPGFNLFSGMPSESYFVS